MLKTHYCPKCGLGPCYERDEYGMIVVPPVYKDMTYHCEKETR